MIKEEIHLKGNIYLQIQHHKGCEFHNIKYKSLTKSVLCIDGVNKTFLGYPRIVYRKGGVNGGEIYFQFWIKGEENSYKANSSWDNFEYYLTSKEGIELLEVALEYIKSLEEKDDRDRS